MTKTDKGEDVHWPSETRNLSLKISSKTFNNTTFDLSSDAIESIIKSSISEWNSHSNISFSTNFTDSKVSLNQSNTISFSEHEGYFGNGILAVTKVSYDEENGKIRQADIIINDVQDSNFIFTDDPSLTSSRVIYLGDVISHELGHFLGLAHSEVIGSTMLYSVFKEQFSLHSDDISGLRNLYGKERSGELSGKILAGSSGNGVFGAHVQAIQVETGKVLNSVLTDKEGNFQIKNLIPYEEYVLFISPIKGKSHLPKFYSVIQNDYCPGQFLSSFFSTCQRKGHPQEVFLPEEKNVGSISIECHSNADKDYLSQKNDLFRESFSFNRNDKIEHQVALFYRSELGSEFDPTLIQKFTLDLSRVEIAEEFDTIVDLKFLPENMMSDVQLDISVQQTGEAVRFYSVSYNDYQKLKLNKIIKKTLSSDQSKNIFSITVNAKLLESIDSEAIFSTAGEFKPDILLIPILVNVGYEGLGGMRYITEKMPLEDNSSCIQGQKDIVSKDYSDLFKNRDSQPSANPSCGTTQNSNQKGNFLFSMAMGLLMVAVMRKSKKISTIILS